MLDLTISCDYHDFSDLARAFDREVEADCPLSAEVVIVSGEEIRALNSKFRGKDVETDVLSFPTLENIRGAVLCEADFPYDTDDEGKLFIGSVVVCEQVARRQAEEFGHSYLRELYYLVTHGMCHLLGYDHETEEDKAQMREKEERVLKRLGLGR